MSGHRRSDGSGVDRKSAERLLSQESPDAARVAAGSGLDRLLTAAARPVQVEPARAEAQESAVLEAFRAARATEAAGAMPAPRRRDDWRARRRSGFAGLVPVTGSARLAVGGLLAAGALGGVAVAGVAGVVDVPFVHRDAEDPPAVEDGTGAPGNTESEQPGGPGPGDGKTDRGAPGTPPDGPAAEKLCRVYSGAGGNAANGPDSKAEDPGNGGRMDRDAYARLVRAAGGKNEVDGYCDRVLAPAAPDKPGKPDAGSTGTNGNANSGNSGDANVNSGAGSEGANAGTGEDNAGSGGSGAGTGEGSTGGSGGTSTGPGEGGNGSGGGTDSGGTTAPTGDDDTSSGGDHANSGGNHGKSGGNHANPAGNRGNHRNPHDRGNARAR